MKALNRQKHLEACLVLAMALLIWYLFKKAEICLYLSLVIGLTGVFFDRPAGWIAWTWFKLGELLGHLMQPIVLSIVFILVLVPIALVYRLFNRDPMGLESRGRKSFWAVRDHTYTKEDLEKMW